MGDISKYFEEEKTCLCVSLYRKITDTRCLTYTVNREESATKKDDYIVPPNSPIDKYRNSKSLYEVECPMSFADNNVEAVRYNSTEFCTCETIERPSGEIKKSVSFSKEVVTGVIYRAQDEERSIGSLVNFYQCEGGGPSDYVNSFDICGPGTFNCKKCGEEFIEQEALEEHLCEQM